MRFLVDTNIFVNAVNSGSPHYKVAREFLGDHLSARTPWATTWPILYEFLRVATHPKVFDHPLKPNQALQFVQALTSSEDIAVLAATPRHAEALEVTLRELSHPRGNLFHDIHTAVVMREHGVREIVTADTDFLQFRFLAVTNPFLR